MINALLHINISTNKTAVDKKIVSTLRQSSTIARNTPAAGSNHNFSLPAANGEVRVPVVEYSARATRNFPHLGISGTPRYYYTMNFVQTKILQVRAWSASFGTTCFTLTTVANVFAAERNVVPTQSGYARSGQQTIVTWMEQVGERRLQMTVTDSKTCMHKLRGWTHQLHAARCDNLHKVDTPRSAV